MLIIYFYLFIIIRIVQEVHNLKKLDNMGKCKHYNTMQKKKKIITTAPSSLRREQQQMHAFRWLNIFHKLSCQAEILDGCIF